jgi:molybdenum cofactor synthesis domain-containing protein
VKSGVLTLSDKGAVGERDDTSGPMIQEMLVGIGAEITISRIIPDQEDLISSTLVDWADNKKLDLIITTGGTGVSPTDVTPEATRRVIDKEVPGISEAMRATSLQKTPRAMLSRGISGIRGTCLIVNLPGSLKGARENLAVILPALSHAVYKIKGGTKDCGGGETRA